MVDEFSAHGPIDPFPRPPDWMLAGLAPEEQALAATVEYQGVPVGHLAPTYEAMHGWNAAIGYGNTSAELCQEIEDHLAEREQAYPDALAWDQVREVMAGAFSHAGRRDFAFNFLRSIRSPHHTVRALVRVAGDQEGGVQLIGAFLEELKEDPVKTNAFLRAYTDWLIEVEPTSPAIEAFENLLAESDPDFDPLESWISSQSTFRPEMHWNTMRSFLEMEGWGSTPLRVRQHVVLRIDAMRQMLVEPSLDVVSGFLEEWAQLELQFPDASIWNQNRGAMSQMLLNADEIQLAVLVGKNMTNSTLQEALAVSLLKRDAEPEALEVVHSMPSMKATARALLDLPWARVGDESTGTTELLRIIDDERGEFTIQQRIACLTVARVRLEQQGDEEDAALFQQKIDELQQRK